MAKKRNMTQKVGVVLRTIGSSLIKKSSDRSLQFGGSIDAALHAISISNIRISTDAFYTIYRNHGDVFACIRELETNVGSAGYLWYNKKDSLLEPNIAEIQEAERILNANSSRRKFEKDLVRHAHISGNAYVHIEKSQSGAILGLKVLDPRTMFVVTDQYGTIIRWVQKVKSDVVTYEADEIVQFKLQDDPNSPVFGLSPMEPVIIDLRSDLAANVMNYAFFENDARPGSQYIFDEDLDESQVDEAIKFIEKQLKGAENKHKTLALKGVKEIKDFNFSHKDMEFIVLRRLTTEKVCAAFGVPKSILNYTDDVNLANGQEQSKKFWEGTIQPLQEAVEEFINKELLPLLGIKEIEIEYTTKSFNDKTWVEASARANVMAGIITINEAREAQDYDKFDPTKHGEFVDKPLIWNALGVRPLEDVGIELDDEFIPAIENEDQAAKEIEKLEKMKQRYQYGRNNEKN